MVDRLNEEMIESLFVCNPAKIGMKGRREEFYSLGDDKTVLLDPRKSQNIAILLKALNVSKEDVCDALLEGETFLSLFFSFHLNSCIKC